jgi:hypothetical protein
MHVMLWCSQEIHRQGDLCLWSICVLLLCQLDNTYVSFRCVVDLYLWVVPFYSLISFSMLCLVLQPMDRLCWLHSMYSQTLIHSIPQAYQIRANRVHVLAKSDEDVQLRIVPTWSNGATSHSTCPFSAATGVDNILPLAKRQKFTNDNYRFQFSRLCI